MQTFSETDTNYLLTFALGLATYFVILGLWVVSLSLFMFTADSD